MKNLLREISRYEISLQEYTINYSVKWLFHAIRDILKKNLTKSAAPLASQSFRASTLPSSRDTPTHYYQGSSPTELSRAAADLCSAMRMRGGQLAAGDPSRHVWWRVVACGGVWWRACGVWWRACGVNVACMLRVVAFKFLTYLIFNFHLVLSKFSEFKCRFCSKIILRCLWEILTVLRLFH